MELELKGKTALVTGASRGIGAAIVAALAEEGVRIAAVARGAEALEAMAAPLRARGAELLTFAEDLSTEEGASRAVAASHQAFGSVDLLVNNVGGSLGAGPLGQATPEQWRRLVDLNLMSAVWCCHHAVGAMKTRGEGGAIVNISSIAAHEYFSSNAGYMVTKAGMEALTKSMAVDLAPHRIRVNTVAPGSILFPGGSWEKRRADRPEQISKMLAEDLPWGRFGAPREVAAAVLFLLSGRATWISGACLTVDGAQGRSVR